MSDPNADYPGEDWPKAQPMSRWTESGTCTYCGHDRDDHGARKCGLLLLAGTSIICHCMYGKDAA